MKFGAVQSIVFIFLIVGCNSPEKDLRRFNLYFDVKDVISYQVRQLTNSNSKVEKIAVINGLGSKTKLSKIDWAKELKIFEAININKPNFKGVFRPMAFAVDSGMVNYYFKAKNAKSDIQFLKVVFTKTNKLVSLEGQDLIKNPVFTARKKYSMRFDTADMKLQSYTLSGSQGFIFFDRDTFDIKAVVFK